MAMEEKLKSCFFIAPIGEEGSEIRLRSDQILEHIIKPAGEECGYDTIRADKISEPGIITSQIIQRLIDDDLVIADLTDRNPNVFYELAVRHTVKKPVVQIIQSGELIPFDVVTTRTINVDHRDLDSVANCKTELIKQIRHVEKDPTKIDSPISIAIELESLRLSKNPLEKSTAEIIKRLQEIRLMIANDDIRVRRLGLSPAFFDKLLRNISRIGQILALADDKEITRELIMDARTYLFNVVRDIERFLLESDFPREIVHDLMRNIRQFPTH